MVHQIIHNLQNRLTVARGFASLNQRKINSLLSLFEKEPSNQFHYLEKAGEDIKMVIDSLEGIQKMVDSLLKRGRKEMADTLQKLNLNEILTSEMQFWEIDPEIRHSVKMTLDLDHALPVIIGDYADFTQVFSNLINNAVDAVRQTPVREITITTKHDADNLFISFRDTGEGGPQQLGEKIFEPFFSTKTAKGEDSCDQSTGTGLGLYSCRKLIEIYNGTISFESKPQMGTTFIVTIPYE